MKITNENSKLILVAGINLLATGLVFFAPSYTDKLFNLYQISVAGLYGTYQLQQFKSRGDGSEGDEHGE